MSRIRQLVRVLVPPGVRVSLRSKWTALRPPRIGEGVGRGLRFDPGRSNPAYARGDNELPVQQAFADHIRRGVVLYDVGANVGFFTVIGARLVGSTGRVIAFEPVPSNARLVRRNAELNGFDNVEVIEKAVSDASGTGELVLAAFSGGAALSTATRPPDETSTITVDLVTLDDVVAAGEFPPPAVVKIDVEGVELAVLEGMRETLRRYRPTIICEIDDGSREGYQLKYDACVGFMQSVDYDVVRLDDSYVGDEWIVSHFVATPPADSA